MQEFLRQILELTGKRAGSEPRLIICVRPDLSMKRDGGG